MILNLKELKIVLFHFSKKIDFFMQITPPPIKFKNESPHYILKIQEDFKELLNKNHIRENIIIHI